LRERRPGVPISILRRIRVGAAAALVGAAAACASDPPMAPSPGPSLLVAAIAPAAGSTTGGTLVTISGKGFSSGTTITLAGVPATGIVVRNPETLTAITPAVATTGVVDVVVSAGGQSATLARGFTFVAPLVANPPPVVTGIRSVGPRANQPNAFADLGQTLTLLATVADGETPASGLTFAWSGAGTFTGTGATVSWTAPASLPATPAATLLTLAVTEPFADGGVTHHNTTTATFVVNVHDSQKEILDMGADFLTLFSQSDVPTDQVLHNFSTTCDGGAGRAAEAKDVDKNRSQFIQDFSKFRLTRMLPVTFNFGGRCSTPNGPRRADACSRFGVHWEVTYKNPPNTGKKEIAEGVDYVSAVYEDSRWFLCHSDFQGTVTNPLLGSTRYVIW
jgi:hypothetical protein